MKVHAIGVTTASGISKKNGKPYAIPSLLVLQPIEPFSNKPADYSKEDEAAGKDYYELNGYGLTERQIAMAEGCMEQFKGIKFPAMIDVETDSEFRGGQMVTVVTGYKQAA